MFGINARDNENNDGMDVIMDQRENDYTASSSIDDGEDSEKEQSTNDRNLNENENDNENSNNNNEGLEASSQRRHGVKGSDG